MLAAAGALWGDVTLDADGILGTREGRVLVASSSGTPFALLDDPDREEMVAAFCRALLALETPIQIVVVRRRVSPTELPDPTRPLLPRLFPHRPLLDSRLYVALLLRRAGRGAGGSPWSDPSWRQLAASLQALSLEPLQPVPVAELAALLDGMMLQPPGVAPPAPSRVERMLGAPWTWFLGPGGMRVRARDILLADGTLRVLYLQGLPPSVRPGCLDRLLRLPIPMALSLHFHPIPSPLAVERVAARLRVLEASRHQAARYGSGEDPYEEALVLDARRLLQSLREGSDRLLQLSVILAVHGENPQEAEDMARQLRAALAEDLFVARDAYLRQWDGHRSVCPLVQERLGVGRILSARTAAHFFPMSVSTWRTADAPVLGEDRVDGTPVCVRRDRLSNPTAVYLGTPGSGKTTLAKVEAARLAACTDVGIFVLDPEGEYTGLVRHLGGEELALHPGSPDRLNCLDIDEDDLPVEMRVARRAATVTALLEPVLGPWDVPTRRRVERAVLAAYKRPPLSTAPPTLRDVVQSLEELDLSGVAAALRDACEGPLSVLSGRTNRHLRSPYLSVNLARVPDPLLPLLYPFLLDFVWNKLSPSRPTVILLDEAHLLLRHPPVRQVLVQMFKRARKRRALLTAVTQNVGDLLASEEGRLLLANAGTVALFHQHPADLSQLKSLLRLSTRQASLLEDPTPGSGLLCLPGRRYALRVALTPEERRWVGGCAESPDQRVGAELP